MKKALQSIVVPMMLVFTVSQSNAQQLVGYHQNWDDPSSPYIPLDQIDPSYTVVNLAFPLTQPGTDYEMYFTPCCGETQAGLIEKIQALQARCVKVNMSVGGSTIPISLDDANERNTFVSSMNNIINTYGLDGLDFDLEGSSLSVSPGSTIADPTDLPIVNMISAIQQLMADYQTAYGKKMFLSASPETAAVQGGQSQWNGIWGSYLPLLEALRTDFDLLHVQLYNSGSMYGLDGNIYSQSTADFIISQTEVVLEGFTAVGGAGYFTGFAAPQVAVGLPACPDAAGGGYTSPDTVKAAIEYLMGTGPKPGSYTLIGGPYPDLGGMMTWSINWDALSSCNNSAYKFAANYVDIFDPNMPWQPDLGADVSLCEISFPYTLNSGTSTNPVVTFTWINLTTDETLVSNNPGAASFDISAGGTYQVQRDSAGCRSTDNISILNDLPEPELPASQHICEIVPLTLTASNAGDFPGGTTWQWYENNVAMPGNNNSSLTNIRTAADYKLAAQKGPCTSEETTVVTSDLPVPEDGCGPSGETVSLSITADSPGPFSWYANSAGGSPLGTGTSFNTPVLYSTTTYYVEDASTAGTATTGPPPADNGLGTLQNWTQSTEITFNAETSFTLKEITVYPLIWCGTHTLTFEIRNSNGDVLVPNGAQSFIINYDSDCSGPMGAVTLTLSFGGVDIPQGNGYKIVQTGSIGINHWQGSVSYPMDFNPYFTITGGNHADKYMAVHDWKIATGTCARMPVMAEINEACNALLPVEFSAFSATLQDDVVLLKWRTESEFANLGFHVQRKAGDGNFENIGWVAAQSGFQNNYQFLDENIRPNVPYYYRLKQEDMDGGYSLSPIRIVETAGRSADFNIFPNPAKDNLYIHRLNGDPYFSSENIEIFNAQGMLVLTGKIEDREEALHIGDLPAGVYLLKIGGQPSGEYMRFVVQ